MIIVKHTGKLARGHEFVAQTKRGGTHKNKKAYTRKGFKLAVNH